MITRHWQSRRRLSLAGVAGLTVALLLGLCSTAIAFEPKGVILNGEYDSPHDPSALVPFPSAAGR